MCRALSSCSTEPAVSTIGLGSSSSRAPSNFSEEESVRPEFTRVAFNSNSDGRNKILSHLIIMFTEDHYVKNL